MAKQRVIEDSIGTSLHSTNELLVGANRLLDLFARKSARKGYLDGVVRLLRTWCSCGCVGIRVLDNEGNIPYGAQVGFGRAFWESENSLSVKRDRCICIRVVKGKAEPQDIPCTTTAGSFHCGDTKAFVSRLSEAERARFRGVCITTGYTSLCVIPIRYRNKIIGAIHLADRRMEAISKRSVEFIEMVSPLIGEAIHRFTLEEELHRSEEKYRGIFENAAEGVFQTTADGRLLSANPSLARMFGFESPEDMTQRVNDVAHQLYVNAEDRTILRGLLEAGESVRGFRTQTYHSDGHKLWVSVNARLVKDEGAGLRYEGTVEDITEQNKAEEDLRFANAYNRGLIEASPDPLVTIDPEGRISDVNRATEAITGCSREELVGTDFSEYFTEPQKARAGYRQVFSKGFVRDYELEIRGRDGSLTPVLYNASVYRDDAGRVIGVFAAARDITEQKRAEEARARLAAIVESSDDAIIGKDLNGMIVSWNQGAERVYGYPAEEVMGQSISILSPPGQREELSAFLARIRRGIPIEHYETERLRKDSQRIYVSLTLSPLKNRRGEIIGASTIARDITAQKRAEEALRLAGTYNRSLIEASLDPLVTIDPEGKISDVNAATEQVTGHSRAELVGTDFSDYFTEPERARTGYQKVFSEGLVRDYALEIQHSDGHTIPVLYNASVYRDETGKVIGVFAAARDMTERKRAEEALRLASAYNRSLIEASLDPLVTIDPEGRISDVNAATELATGYSREELIGTDFSEYFTEPEKARSGYRQVFMEGLVRNYELGIRHRDGHIIPVLYNASVYKDETGNIIGVFAAARDITERKQAQEALQRLLADLELRVKERTRELSEANQLLQAVNKELESFSYSVSHDLRAPLRAIDGFSRMLVKDYADKLDEEGKRKLNIIRSNTQTMGQLIDDLLTFSRLGRKEMGSTNLDMEGLVRSAWKELSLLSPERELKLVLHKLPRSLGDQTLIRQVVVNLLSNAIKFSKSRGGALVEVGAYPEGERNVYFVKDNGVGFDMQYYNKLFGVFQRLHSTDEFEGTGVGLAIVERIIRRHGGKAWAEGKVGEGATFYFTLAGEKE